MDERQRMADNGQKEQQPPEQPAAPDTEKLAESWKDVGDHIQHLFTSIATTFRQAWSQEQPEGETQRGVQDVRASLDRLERVMKRVAENTEPQRAKTLEATREASERAVQEARSATASGLKTLSDQLQQLVQRLEQQNRGGSSTDESTEQPPKELPPTM